MFEDNVNEINVLEMYNSNMLFLSKFHRELYNKIRLFELELGNDANKQKYELKFNKTYFDVYHKESKDFLYNQESNVYSKNIVNQIEEDSIKNNFEPYIRIDFPENYIKEIDSKDIMSRDLAAAAPVIDYVKKNKIEENPNENVHKFIFFGVALGLHINEVHKRFNCKVYLICESDLELFRLSLFTIDYANIAKSSELFFSIADEDKIFQEKCSLFLQKRYILNYNLKYNLFSLRAAHFIKLFQMTVTTQSFITYDYTRRFMASNRPFQYSVKKYNFLDVSINKNRTSVLSNHPTLILAAGPSLLKNIQWLINNQTKFIIITISVNLKLLYKYGIKPDVIIHIDEDKKGNLLSLVDIDMDFFSEALVLFSSITDSKIVEKYEKNSIFILQALTNYYNDLQTLFGASVGEVTYAFGLLYGSKDIYLLGLDLALDPITNQSHSEYHTKNVTHEIDDKYKHEYLDLSKNYIKIKGNFRENLYTNTILHMSISEVNLFTQGLKSKDTNIYNLSDGAYFENTNPLEIDAINMDSFSPLNKSEIKLHLNEDLLKNSRNELNDYDKKVINRKIKNAKYIRQLIKLQMSKISYKEIKDFLIDIEDLIHKITAQKDKTNSAELNCILFEYTRLVSHYVYEFCEQKSKESDALIHVKNINKIFTTQLLKITDKYIDTIQGNMNKI